ncbi:hypothetical protein ABMB68_009824 [Bradyrhizobium sp. RT4a]
MKFGLIAKHPSIWPVAWPSMRWGITVELDA